MKKLIAFLTIAGIFMFSVTVFAQDTTEEGTEQVADTTVVDTTVVAAQPEAPVQTIPDEPEETQGFHQVLKEKFIEGDAMFMSFVLLALVFGLAICIERIIYLNLSTTNTKKLLNNEGSGT